ncbi:MAG: hypothetical protein IJS89_07475 [Bacteroidaceae bacterium]|nr:hypothetical protein [Bacteroidaceae bacterium]
MNLTPGLGYPSLMAGSEMRRVLNSVIQLKQERITIVLCGIALQNKRKSKEKENSYPHLNNVFLRKSKKIIANKFSFSNFIITFYPSMLFIFHTT